MQGLRPRSPFVIGVESNRYSVPVRHAHQRLILQAYVDRVEVYAALQRVVCHPRCYGRDQDILELDHYLELLRDKPGALSHAKPLQMAQLPPIYQTFWAALQLFHPHPAKEFVAILFLHREFPPAQVAAALAEAHAAGTYRCEAVREHLLRAPAAAPGGEDRWSRADVRVAPPQVHRFNALLGKGVEVH